MARSLSRKNRIAVAVPSEDGFRLVHIRPSALLPGVARWVDAQAASGDAVAAAVDAADLNVLSAVLAVMESQRVSVVLVNVSCGMVGHSVRVDDPGRLAVFVSLGVLAVTCDRPGVPLVISVGGGDFVAWPSDALRSYLLGPVAVQLASDLEAGQ